MIEAVASSALADILVAAVLGVMTTSLGVAVQTLREVRRMDRILLGEDAVDADRGVVGKVRDLNDRVERLEQAGRRSSDD